MPSGYTTALPQNIGIGVGVLYYNATTPFGVSDGGIRVRPDRDEENLPFDNKGSPIEGLDIIWSDHIIISGDFIELPTTLWSADILEPGATPATAGTPATVTYTPQNNRTFFAVGDSIPNLVYEITMGDNTKRRYVCAKARCVSYEIVGQTRSAHKISCEFHSRLSATAAATSTDAKSYTVETVAAS
jgi:hypothetical protein